jgi:hypothetical protein
MVGRAASAFRSGSGGAGCRRDFEFVRHRSLAARQSLHFTGDETFYYLLGAEEAYERAMEEAEK